MPDIITCLFPLTRLSTRNNSFKTSDELKLEWLLNDFKTFDNLMSLEKPDDKHKEQNSNYSLTLVSRRWERTYNCKKDGGDFRKPGSDVVLHIPPGAVECEDHVVIHAAVCADVDRIRRVLQLPDHEVIVSPLAEYWAGQDFQFQCPVTITLPHCLPDNYDPSLVRVYRVSHGHNGQVRVTRVKQGQDFENTNQDEHFPWEDSGHFVVSSEGKVQVFTQHFCGYVCTYCGHSQNSPELVAMAYGSHEKTQTGRYNVTVHLYVWDKRIDIADFRNDYDIGLNEKRLRRMTVSLLDDLQDSKLSLKLQVIGDDAERWQHLKLDESLVFPVEQEQTLKDVLSCDNTNCERSKSAPPMTMTWKLQTNGDITSCNACAVVIDISHLHVGTSVEWKNRPQSEAFTRHDLKIPLEEPSTVIHCEGCVCPRSNESRLAPTMQTTTDQARQEATREWGQATHSVPRPCSRDDTVRKVCTTLTQAPEASRRHQAEIPPASDSQLISGSANCHRHLATAASNVPATTDVELSRSSNAVENQITNHFTFNFASSASSTNGPIINLPVGVNTITEQREDRHALALPPDSMSLPPAAIEQGPRQLQLQWYPQQSHLQSAAMSTLARSVADSGPALAGSMPPTLPTPVSNAESAMIVETEDLQTFERGLQNGVHDSLHNGMPNGNSSAVSRLAQHMENGVHSPGLDSDPSELRFRSPQPVSDHDDISRSREV